MVLIHHLRVVQSYQNGGWTYSTERLATGEDWSDESDGSLSVGLEFSSYEDLCSTIKTYEQLHSVTLYK